MKKTEIPSVNFHITNSCNMKCRYCFAHYSREFNGKELAIEDQLKVIEQIVSFGFKKISFAGGEPTLIKNLPDLVKYAKECGLVTVVVSNGSCICKSFFEKVRNYLDWISISIDSLNEDLNHKIGRRVKGRVINDAFYKNTISMCKDFNISLKLNTVVSAFNYMQDFNDFIKWANPDRWKIFQVLPIIGQNNFEFDMLKVSEIQFEDFIKRHKNVISDKTVIEYNTDMKGSYVMIDPYGRFYNNKNGTHEYSEAILKEGIDKTFHSMSYSVDKFEKRGGYYEFLINKKIQNYGNKNSIKW